MPGAEADGAGQGGLPAVRKGQAAGAGQDKAGRPQAGSAAKPADGTARPKTGVPPWEITDSFLAIPAADADTGGPAPAVPGQSTAPADAADSTESFPAVDSGAQQRSFPGSNPGDSTESFPALRPRADIEDAFRLFPPVRGTENRPAADDQD